MEAATTKTCSRCNEAKPLDSFAIATKAKDGRFWWCKSCSSIYRKERRTVGPAEPRERRPSTLRPEVLHGWALTVRNELIRRHAVESDDGEAHGYLKVSELCLLTSLKRSQWKQVQRQMYRVSIPLAVDDFGGYYLGKVGSQGTMPAMLLKRARTLIETAMLAIEAQQESPDWDASKERLGDELAKAKQSLRVEDLPKLGRGAGLEVSDAFDRLLLTSGK